MSARRRILCISLSPITSDARVLRQISLLAEFGDVTTVGFGEIPAGATEHLQLPTEAKTLPQTPLGVLALALRRWRYAERAAPAVRAAARLLRGREFDLVVANEARVLGLAHSVAGEAPVWADMHEWAPEERTHILSWRILVAPFITDLCARYLPRSALVTTVGGAIADLYRARFGVTAEVMRNSGPFQALRPTAVEPDRFRLVHSGTAVHGRSLETMIDVVLDLDERYTLDLYLMPAGDGGRYLASLRERAGGSDRIRFNDPVAPHELPTVLNAYDIGVFWIPPTHTNARYTLPNKFFDFVQARLAIAVGPSVEMQTLVEQYHLGRVSDGFSVEECRASISGFTSQSVRAGKEAAEAAASELSFETDAAQARARIAALFG
jgi:hypothetical protein